MQVGIKIFVNKIVVYIKQPSFCNTLPVLSPVGISPTWKAGVFLQNVMQQAKWSKIKNFGRFYCTVKFTQILVEKTGTLMYNTVNPCYTLLLDGANHELCNTKLNYIWSPSSPLLHLHALTPRQTPSLPLCFVT